jgi:hypothetical protein
MRFLSLIFIAVFFMSNSCRKNPLPEYYFTCKINGQEYIPNGCANCITCLVLGDTTFILGGNRGFEALVIGIIKLDRVPISQEIYLLNDNPQQGATYKNSTTTYDKYETDQSHIGRLQISDLNRADKIISGNFFFKAYNSFRNDSVNVTDGRFRLKYTTY